MTQATLDAETEKSSIPIGGVGFQFIKKFNGHWYNREVHRILDSGKRVCKFNDSEHKQYSLNQVENFSNDINSDGIDFEEGDEDTEDNKYME